MCVLNARHSTRAMATKQKRERDRAANFIPFQKNMSTSCISLFLCALPKIKQQVKMENHSIHWTKFVYCELDTSTKMKSVHIYREREKMGSLQFALLSKCSAVSNQTSWICLPNLVSFAERMHERARLLRHSLCYIYNALTLLRIPDTYTHFWLSASHACMV